MKKIKTTIHLSKECKDMLISVAKSRGVTMSVMAEDMITDCRYFPPVDKPGRLETMPKLANDKEIDFHTLTLNSLDKEDKPRIKDKDEFEVYGYCKASVKRLIDIINNRK